MPDYLTEGLWRSREGEVYNIHKTTSPVWCWQVFDKKQHRVEPPTWNSRGFVSIHLCGENEIVPKSLYTPRDLVEPLTRDKYPEYYL